MPKKIQPRGASRFVTSQRNPNPHGECLCSPGSRHEDCTGPFLIFTHANMEQVGGKAPLAVLSSACAKSAVVQIERGDEIGVIGSGSAADDAFDGGEPTEPEDEVALRALYEAYVRDVGLLEALDWDTYREEAGFPKNRSARPLETTGIDPNESSLLQEAADSRPVGQRGGTVYGVTSEPGAFAHVGTPDEVREED